MASKQRVVLLLVVVGVLSGLAGVQARCSGRGLLGFSRTWHSFKPSSKTNPRVAPNPSQGAQVGVRTREWEGSGGKAQHILGLMCRYLCYIQAIGSAQEYHVACTALICKRA
eukprot:SAG31_NODE_1466_length_8227_cov_10.254675_7_plen_112_part_00